MPLTNYNITYTGNKFVGETMTFYCDAPDNVFIKWGVSEQYSKAGIQYYYERNLTHVFDSIGTYYIDAVLYNNNTRIAVEINVPYSHADITRMCLPRLWNVVVDSQRIGQAVTILNQYTDNFGITFINDTTVVFKNDTLKSSNSNIGVAKVYRFSGNSDLYSFRNLEYYYQQDSIVYDTHPNQGGLSQGNSAPHYYGTTTHYKSKK